jgi:hypothetical protein
MAREQISGAAGEIETRIEVRSSISTIRCANRNKYTQLHGSDLATSLNSPDAPPQGFLGLAIARQAGCQAGMASTLRFTAIPAQMGPGVRIRLAPAGSLQTIGPGRPKGRSVDRIAPIPERHQRFEPGLQRVSNEPQELKRPASLGGFGDRGAEQHLTARCGIERQADRPNIIAEILTSRPCCTRQRMMVNSTC